MAIVWKRTLNGNSNALVWPNGTATNITFVDWKSNWAGSFNWTSSFIEIVSDTLFDFWTQYFVNTLIFINSLPTTWNLATIIYRLNTASNWPQFEFVLYNDWWTQKIFVSQATTFNPINYTLPTGKWINLSVWYASNTITFYLDWLVIWTVSQSTQCWTSNKKVTFWVNYQPTNNRFFNWKIDEIEIHNTNLSPAEIKNKALFYNWFI